MIQGEAQSLTSCTPPDLPCAVQPEVKELNAPSAELGQMLSLRNSLTPAHCTSVGLSETQGWWILNIGKLLCGQLTVLILILIRSASACTMCQESLFKSKLKMHRYQVLWCNAVLLLT